MAQAANNLSSNEKRQNPDGLKGRRGLLTPFRAAQQPFFTPCWGLRELGALSYYCPHSFEGPSQRGVGLLSLGTQ